MAAVRKAPILKPIDLSGVGRTHLEKEVRAHRVLWRRVAQWIQFRDNAHRVAEATRDLPPTQKAPYIRVQDARLLAVRAAMVADARTLDAIEEMLAEWPATLQKSFR